ncbi:hypothetical protein J27TS8_22590 [Robertmurraya siralis]|uniref:Uncharacterized protein n=1 Tax=Robertmurraya siralis TaxID=77777 RepID=A0A919WID9_9BACI|nr:hypothetical protein J27TS8_22590 [Robertmurraya siralis]
MRFWTTSTTVLIEFIAHLSMRKLSNGLVKMVYSIYYKLGYDLYISKNVSKLKLFMKTVSIVHGRHTVEFCSFGEDLIIYLWELQILYGWK